METELPLTLDLLVAFGLYCLAAGIGGVLAPERWIGMLDDLGRPAVSYIAGFAVFAIGVAIILAHNLWTDPLAVLVSLLGWGAAIEGLILIAWPAPLLAIARSFLGSTRLWAFVSVFIGAVLIAIGMTARAAPVIYV